MSPNYEKEVPKDVYEERRAAAFARSGRDPRSMSIVLSDIEFNRDSRVAKIGARELSGLFYKHLRLSSSAAEMAIHGKGIGKSERLMRLAEDEKLKLSRMRAQASEAGKTGESTEDGYMTESAYQARTDYISTSKNQREIKALLLELGLAEMLLLGDWKVNREGSEKAKIKSPIKNESNVDRDTKPTDIAVSASLSDDIASSLGIVSFPEIEKLILQFHNENGLLATTAPIKQGKLAALDLGCGNGVTGERLRRDPTDPFQNGRRLLNYWIEIGFADKIYWTLSDFIYGLLRDEHKNDPAILEFIEVVSRLLILRINNIKRHPPKQLNKYDKTILELATNPNIIRVILPNLEHYIRKFKDLKRIRADGEFELDSEHVLSLPCEALIKEFFEGPELFRGLGGEKDEKQAARAFLNTYFREEAIEHEDKVERDLNDNAERINRLEERYLATTEEIRPISQKMTVLKREERASAKAELADLNVRFTDLVKQREAIKAEKKALTDEKEELEKRRATDLAGEITMYLHNVILGDFAEFKNIIPQSPTFDWVRSWRASSHANDTQYAELMYECANRLKPGGIITEDGKRESYTRFERIQELRDLQDNLGYEYQVSLIAKSKGPVGVLIERAVKNRYGELVFFSEQKGQQLMREGASLIPVDEFATRWPEMEVRNQIIGRLKGLFIDSALKDCAPEEIRTRTHHGRMQFRHLHRAVDACLEKNPNDVEKIWEDICREIDAVRRRISLVAKGATLLQGDRAVVQTFSPRPIAKIQENNIVAESRDWKAQSLPRNLDVPDLSDPKLEQERASLVTTLTEIAKLTNGPALRLHLYDCFTDGAMSDTILKLLGADKDPGKKKLLEVVNVNIKGRHDPVNGEKIHNYPTQQDGVIDIFGGSTNDAYDAGGKRYIDEFMVPWLQRIEDGFAVRGLGICFGSQCMLEAMGKVKDFEVKTQRGALQFGPFPVVFGTRHVAVKHLELKACTGVFTRSGYSIPDDSPASKQNLRPLAYEGKMNVNGLWFPNRDLPPVAYSLSKGRAITAQMHLETSLKDPRHTKDMVRYASRHAGDLAKAFGPNIYTDFTKTSGPNIYTGVNPLASPNFLRDNHFSLQAQSISGENTNWVAKDIGMAFLIPSLLHLATDLLAELKKSKSEMPSDSPAPAQ